MSVLSLPAWWRKRINRYRLIGAKCPECGRIHYPPRPACPYCGYSKLEPVELPRIGTLESYTVVYSVPGDHRLDAPIIVGLVDLGPTRIIAELTDVLPEELHTGMKVEAVVRKIDEQGESGIIAYAVKFRPVLHVSGAESGSGGDSG